MDNVLSYSLKKKTPTRETDTIEPNSFKETLCKATQSLEVESWNSSFVWLAKPICHANVSTLPLQSLLLNSEFKNGYGVLSFKITLADSVASNSADLNVKI